MALEEDLAEDGTSAPADSTSQVPQTTPLDASEDLNCPICLNTITDEASVSWCIHIFCFPCILNWSYIRNVCPICRQQFFYIFHNVGESNYEVYYRQRDNSFTRRAQGGSYLHHTMESRQNPSLDAARDQDQASRPERGAVVSMERSEHWRRRGRVPSRERHETRGRSQLRARTARRQTRWDQPRRRDVIEGQDLSPALQGPDFSQGRERQRRRGRVSSREQHETRGRSQLRSRSPLRHQAQQEQTRRTDGREGGADPELQGPAYSQGRQRRRRGGRVSSRERQETRSRSRSRSRSPRRQTEQNQPRRRDGREGQALSPALQGPAYSQGRQRRRRGGRVSSRERHETRSRPRSRSRSPARPRTW